MPHRCQVYGCDNTPDEEQGISVHIIPFFNDTRQEARKRRKRWVDFIARKRAKWMPTRYSAVCSEHFLPEDFERQFATLPGMHCKLKRNLNSDEFGITAFPSVFMPQRKSAKKQTARSKRMVSKVRIVVRVLID